MIEELMCAAMEDIRSGKMSANMAVDSHGIPWPTLNDRLSERIIHGEKPGPHPYLDLAEEDEVSENVFKAVKIGYGKTR